MANSLRYLHLIDALVRGLNHHIRTPLSTISNELHYLGSITDAKEVARSTEKCKEITSFLTSIQIPGSKSDFRQEPLSEVLKSLEGAPLTDLTCRCILEPLQHSFNLIYDFMKSESADARVSVSIDNDDASVQIHLSYESGYKSALHGAFESLTLFCTEQLQRDAHRLAIAEAILLAHDANISFSCYTHNDYQITLPLHHD